MQAGSPRKGYSRDVPWCGLYLFLFLLLIISWANNYTLQSQLKKLFFGALRIRKEQEAKDPGLAHKRLATSIIVWDAIKNRMDEALERVRK